MVKSHIETVSREEEVIDGVLCNCCGKPINTANMIEYLSISHTWGYSSKWDNEKHDCDICQDCCEKIASTFVIPINII